MCIVHTDGLFFAVLEFQSRKWNLIVSVHAGAPLATDLCFNVDYVLADFMLTMF